jgi:hypothetical protein
MDKVTKLFLLANAAVFWGFAAAGLLAPAWLAAQLDMTLGSTTALADFRAVYGGLCLGIGELLVMAISKEALQRPAITLATLMCGGLALGRIVTLATAGAAGPYIYASLASEVACAAVGAWLLRAPARSPLAA